MKWTILLMFTTLLLFDSYIESHPTNSLSNEQNLPYQESDPLISSENANLKELEAIADLNPLSEISEEKIHVRKVRSISEDENDSSRRKSIKKLYKRRQEARDKILKDVQNQQIHGQIAKQSYHENPQSFRDEVLKILQEFASMQNVNHRPSIASHSTYLRDQIENEEQERNHELQRRESMMRERARIQQIRNILNFKKYEEPRRSDFIFQRAILSQKKEVKEEEGKAIETKTDEEKITKKMEKAEAKVDKALEKVQQAKEKAIEKVDKVKEKNAEKLGKNNKIGKLEKIKNKKKKKSKIGKRNKTSKDLTNGTDDTLSEKSDKKLKKENGKKSKKDAETNTADDNIDSETNVKEKKDKEKDKKDKKSETIEPAIAKLPEIASQGYGFGTELIKLISQLLDFKSQNSETSDDMMFETESLEDYDDSPTQEERTRNDSTGRQQISAQKGEKMKEKSKNVDETTSTPKLKKSEKIKKGSKATKIKSGKKSKKSLKKAAKKESKSTKVPK